jgi:acetyl esterase/lipase
MNVALLTLGLALGIPAADPPRQEPLWPDKAPGALGDKPEDKPSLTAYLPAADKATGTAVVVCPGGGYGGLALDHEGKQIADWLNEHGIAAFVLRYRVKPYRHPVPLQDAQRAMRTVRSRAKEWGIDPQRIGIWGFSAGGHLASTAATHFDDGKADDPDPIERASCRPDFAILCYPVITMTDSPTTHMGSRKNLLGDKPDEKLAESLSNQTQVTERTPPTFLFSTGDDAVVPVENSVLFYLALRKMKIPAELHVYEKGPHGVGLAKKMPALSSWPDRLADWLAAHNLLKPAKP